MFAELLDNPSRSEPADLQRLARSRFPSFVSRSHLLERRPSDPIPPGTYILIGVASYSPLELELLDEVDGQFADWNARLQIATFDSAACQTTCALNQYLPGVDPIVRTPIVGVWQDARLVATGQGLHEVRPILKAHTVVG